MGAKQEGVESKIQIARFGDERCIANQSNCSKTAPIASNIDTCGGVLGVLDCSISHDEFIGLFELHSKPPRFSPMLIYRDRDRP